MPKCNGCGKTIEQAVDNEPPLIIRHSFGYDSKRDSENLDAILCSDCTEDLADYLVLKCVISPIYETVAVNY